MAKSNRVAGMMKSEEFVKIRQVKIDLVACIDMFLKFSQEPALGRSSIPNLNVKRQV